MGTGILLVLKLCPVTKVPTGHEIVWIFFLVAVGNLKYIAMIAIIYTLFMVSQLACGENITKPLATSS